MVNFFTKKLDFQSKILFKNSSWVFLSNFIGALLAFLKALIIARGLGAELYGIFTIIIVFISTIQEVLNLNLGAAIIRFGSKFMSDFRPDKIAAMLKLTFFFSCLMAVISILIIIAFTFFSYDTFVKSENLEWFVILYAIAASSIFFNNISRSTLRLYFRFKKNSILQMVMDLIDFIIVLIALLGFPKNLEAFLIAILVTRFINGTLPITAAWKELRPELGKHLSAPINLIKNEFKSIRKFTISNSVSNTLQALVSKGDVLLLAMLSSNPLSVAYYNIGKKLAFAFLTLTDPLASSVYPQFCKLYAENDIKSIRKMLFRLTGITFIPSLLFMVIAFFFNEWIMEILFGKEFINAGTTFAIITVAALIQAVFFWMQPLLQALDLMVVRIKILVAGIISGLVSAYMLTPEYGSTGMAFALIIMNAVMPGMYLYFIIRKMNLEENRNK